MSYALGGTVHFLGEERTELYKWYIEGVPQLKNVLCAKNTWQRWALSGLERCGV